MKLRPFELALVIFFGILALAAIVLLSTYKPGAKTVSNDPAVLGGPIQIWGTLPRDPVITVINELALKNDSYKQVSYRYVSPDEFDVELTNALADGVGPDLILASHERLVEQRRRIQPVDYVSYPLRDIQTQYLDGASIFALSDGIYGFPIMVDPLMMYWNKDILTDAGFLNAPKTWEELMNTQFPKLINRGFDRSINRSVIAMGEYGNIRNAFATVSLLIIQGGSRTVTESAGRYTIELQYAIDGNTDPFRSAVDFFLRFAKPSNALYSWNRSFTEDRTQFISEDLAFYFGYGSEGREIERLNPNLRFDIAEVPQGATATKRRTYGQFYAISALKSSKNLSGAFKVMSTIGGVSVANTLAQQYNMVPAYRSSVSAGSNDTYGRFTYQSAAIASGWLNPSLAATNNIFATMMSDISENRSDLTTAVLDTTSRLKSEYE